MQHDLALNDAVRDALASELRDELVEPVMDWDRLRNEGRAQFAVVPPVVAQAVSGPIHGSGGWRGCGSSWERALASLALVESGVQ